MTSATPPLCEVTQEGVVVFSPGGYVNDVGGQQVSDACVKHLEQGERLFVVDLTEARDVNSMGISAMFDLLERAGQVGARVAFCGLGPGLRRTFTVMGVTQLGTIYETRDEAIQALKIDSQAG